MRHSAQPDMKFRHLIILLLCLASFTPMKAQDVAVKTNLLYDAVLTPNIGVEVGVAPKWTIDVTGQLNAWTVNEHYWKHWLAQPEARYWFCQRFAGHFVGAHALGGQFNVGNLDIPVDFLGTDFHKLKDYRYQGWMVGAGVAYGYSWILDRHWNIEAEIGLGWIYTRFDTYRCANCGKKVRENQHHNYYGPTKAAINLRYTF